MTRRLAPTGAIVSVLLLFAARPASAERPSAPWRTIETRHFRVHFPAPFEEWASRAAAELEAVHPRLADFIGYSPSRPIDVLVSDPQADSNGLAYPFLDRPRIELWTTPPESESGLGDFRDWTEVLVTHELAHILHLTRPRNRPSWLERWTPIPLGPVALHAPRWVAEGYATLVEGALTGSGRPGSSYRAMILRRFALEGKLPSYGALDGTSGWLGGSMAYLVGSSFLEWLEEREAHEAHEARRAEPSASSGTTAARSSLTRLWKRMASKRGGSFDEAFRAVFRRSPSDLYDLFRAEITARAVEQERRLEAEGIVAGERWQRLAGGTASLAVSPDGSRLLARRSPKRGRSELIVWTIEPSESERAAREKRERRDRDLASDPNEIPDLFEPPERREPTWTLPAANGRAAEDPRWLPDGRVLFTRREPDRDGVLHRDLFVWDLASGGVARRTVSADVGDADPAPDGTEALAVRNRFGRSELVRVDLATGRVVPYGSASSALQGPRELWSHPRISPDGSRVAVLRHREGSWRLVLLDVRDLRDGRMETAAGGVELAAGAGVFGPPAWSPDGRHIYVASDASGTWDLAALDVEGGGVRTLTRVTGGAFSPAPEPDGRALFCLQLTAKGIDVARLALSDAALPAAAERLPPLAAPPGRSSSPGGPEPLVLAPVPASRPYRTASTSVVRLFSAFSAGPDGQSWQAGAQGSDVVGRFEWIAAGAVGDAAGPRGGFVAAAWLGWPISLRGQIFTAIEKPGSQRLVSRPELDQDRYGGALTAGWEAEAPWGKTRIEGFAGASHVEALASGETFERSLVGGRGRVDWRRFRGRSGLSLTGAAGGAAGWTDGSSWTLGWAEAAAAGSAAGVRLSLSGRAGHAGGSPTPFDLFAIGGASSSVLPPALDPQRVESPALPAAAQLGDRFEGLRAELSGAGFPLLLFAERWRAWSGGGPTPEPIRLEGIEARLERLVPLDLPESLSFYAGVARVRSATPRFDSIRGYAGLVYRP